MSKLFILTLAVVIFSAIGCGGYIPFMGKVTFSDDGTPLTQGTVCFVSSSHLARGKLNPDGSYELGSLKANDGLPPGKYQVYVSDAYEKRESPRRDNEGYGNPLIAQKFMQATTSGLTVDVSSDVRTFDFKVDRPAKPK